MAESTLIVGYGAKEVHRAELVTLEPPARTRTWVPIKHLTVLETVEGQLQDAGFQIADTKLALSHEANRLFATMDLTTSLSDGVCLSIGLRNSHDKTFPIGLAAGSRVMVCSNLAMRAETVVAKRHTAHGLKRFVERLSTVVAGLHLFRDMEAKRIEHMKSEALTDDRANSLILQAFERDIVSTRLLPKVIQEYREPRHEDFRPRVTWSLLNAFTEVLKARLTNPGVYTATTIKLQGMLCSDPQLALAA